MGVKSWDGAERGPTSNFLRAAPENGATHPTSTNLPLVLTPSLTIDEVNFLCHVSNPNFLKYIPLIEYRKITSHNNDLIHN